MSRADFCKCLGIVLKELAEVRYWLELIGEREWMPKHRLNELLAEAEALSRVFNAMVARTKRNDQTS